MLRKLLEILQANELHSREEMAEQLGISLGMLAELIQQLVRLGYLEELRPGCDANSACGRCDVRAGCHQPAKLWRLTDKALGVNRMIGG